MQQQVWTVSNVLSLLRLLLVVPLVWALWEEATPWVLSAGLIAFLTDVADGMLARQRQDVTDLGKVLDPLADKVVAGASALVLVLQQKLPLWFALLVVGRDALLLLGGWLAWRWAGSVLPSLPPGKWTALAIAATLLAGYLRWEDWVAVGIALSVLGMVSSTGVYVRRWWEVYQRWRASVPFSR
ncbi:MAG: CDP-alcohol phosphatidyltransferase family protein [Candidatus Kapabacteria bacterium]|nr:CDP-alcohol phosphatidyltransferase family protein [Candidatus Kapabacteria bacterium]MCS7169072.1 CDP-alcohol phosphatidyltransferase family protein [Candidatus Kapabacteria bacterium]MDW7996525.1 CDP-alcohol phosphatidyltransferase family protein [Bacteroidota bacterium]MDW8225790.1 CDP-alcohol phosphatidyltransferase family protein [Bacteroidota bacterium]